MIDLCVSMIDRHGKGFEAKLRRHAEEDPLLEFFLDKSSDGWHQYVLRCCLLCTHMPAIDRSLSDCRYQQRTADDTRLKPSNLRQYLNSMVRVVFIVLCCFCIVLCCFMLFYAVFVSFYAVFVLKNDGFARC